MADPVIEDFVEGRLQKLTANCTPEDKERIKNALIQNLSLGTTIKESLGMSPNEIESMYNFGYNLFKTGKLADSIIMMRILMTLDPDNARYPFAIAAAYQKMKQFENAVTFYLLASDLDKESPAIHFHMADCLVNMHEFAGAAFMLGKVMDRCQGHPEHDILKNRAQMMFDSISKQVREEEEKKQGTPQGGE